MVDQVANFKKVTVSTGYNNTATSIVLATGQGAELPDPSGDNYNVVWWDSTNYNDPADDPNVEIVRVTAKSTDTLTVTRNQESSGASNKNNADATYKMILPTTAKTITDLIADVEKAATVIVGKSGHVDYLTTDYGTDNACIQAAIDYVVSLSGGIILIREGSYDIEAKLTVPNDEVILIGNGKNTIFNIIGAGIDCLEVGTSSRNTYHFGMRDILIQGKAVSQGDAYTTGDTIKLINCKECDFMNVEIQKGDNGILIHGINDTFSSSLIKFNNMKVSLMDTYGIDIRSVSASNSSYPWNNAHFFSGCYIQHNGVGVHIERESLTLSGSCSHHMFSNCFIETSDAGDELLEIVKLSYIQFVNVMFDGVGGNNQISLDADSSRISFLNTHFDCDIVDNAANTYILNTKGSIFKSNGTTNEERALNISNSGIYAGSWGYLTAKLTNASATGHLMQLVNEGTGRGVFIDQNGNGVGIELQSAATTAPALNINVPSGATHIHMVPVAASPGSPVEGDLYADTDHHLYYYNGTTWVSIA